MSLREVLVTGSAGFLGKALTKHLKKQGYSVKGLDLKQGTDVADWDQIKKLRGFQIMIHLAAKTFIPSSFNQPRIFYRSNLLSTVNILELSRINKAKVIFASSYVYGYPNYMPIDENHPTAAHNPYSESKLLAEQLCRGYQRDFGLQMIIMRAFNLYGPGQRKEFLIPHILESTKKGNILLGEPEYKRDYVYLDDAVDAYRKAVEYKHKGLEIFNIGYGKSYSVRELVDLVKNCCGKNVPVQYDENKRKGEIPDAVADIRKARSILGWQPRIDIETGIRKLIQSMVSRTGE
jgi:UDP-glucose 4-epimerase